MTQSKATMAFVRNCLFLLSLAAHCDAAGDALAPLQQRLEENRLNIQRLQKEKILLQEELGLARLQRDSIEVAQQRGQQKLDAALADSNGLPPSADIDAQYQEQQHALRQLADALGATDAEVADLTDSIQLADVLISNISTIVARQRAELEKEKQGPGRSALDIALSKAVAKNQEQLAATQAANEAARDEINRLRALLLEIMSAEEKADEATQPAAPQAPAKPPATSKSAAKPPPSETDLSPAQLAEEKKYAQEEYLRLLSMFEQPDPEQRANKRVTVSGLIDGRIRYSSDETMTYLGYGQYHFETQLQAGEVTILLDGKRWKQRVRKRDANQQFVIIYDAADPKLPRLVVFKKSLVAPDDDVNATDQ